MGRLELAGVYTAIVTPFTADSTEVDYEALGALIDAQIAGGVAGVVPIGTTGESPTLTNEERHKIIEFCVKRAAGKIAVMAGTGSNNTAATVEATKKAKELGVDCCLLVNPYYNKPSQEGLYQHVKAVAAVGLPICLYNIPSRTGIQMSPETIARAYKDFPEVCAVKEATGSLDSASEIASLCNIAILSGDDSLTLPLMSIGGKGVVSVLSNLAPEQVTDMVKIAADGDFATAATLHKQLFKVFKTMFIETNPVPCKFAMAMNGMCTPAVRLPLVQMTDANAQILTDVLVEKGLVSAENASKRPKLG